jgi:hypothetical protein
MYIGKCSGVAMILAILTPLSVAAAPDRAPASRQHPSPKTVAKLIGQLEAPDLGSRRQASAKLEEFGGSVLPALRQALGGMAKKKSEPEP